MLDPNSEGKGRYVTPISERGYPEVYISEYTVHLCMRRTGPDTKMLLTNRISDIFLTTSLPYVSEGLHVRASWVPQAAHARAQHG